MDNITKQRIESELMVYLDEDCGFRQWLWFPKMSLQQLAVWWAIQENISEFTFSEETVGLRPPYKLHGDFFLAEAEADSSEWHEGFMKPDSSKAWICTETTSFLITSEKQLVVDRSFPSESLQSVRKRLSRHLD